MNASVVSTLRGLSGRSLLLHGSGLNPAQAALHRDRQHRGRNRKVPVYLPPLPTAKVPINAPVEPFQAVSVAVVLVLVASTRRSALRAV